MFSFFNSRKAQGMSFNVIIIAAICLLVLVVLVLIFSGKMSFFNKAAAECSSKGPGAKCVATTAECDGPTHSFGTSCANTTPYCCVPISGSSK
jgi:ABC-type sugar transport system permease subunit